MSFFFARERKDSPFVEALKQPPGDRDRRNFLVKIDIRRHDPESVSNVAQGEIAIRHRRSPLIGHLLYAEVTLTFPVTMFNGYNHHHANRIRSHRATPMPDHVEFNHATGTPHRLAQFLILGELGSGGMGTVYRAKDEKLGNVVALKLIRPELSKDPSARERFLREAKAVAALRDHDHIVTVFSVHEIALEDGRVLLFLVMPVLQGESLQDRILRAKGKPLPVREQVAIARQIARGLVAAHDEGLVHRDIKPGNIWLEARKDGSTRVKILDFGLVRSVTDAQLTASGVAMGTPAFMAPEQGISSEVDHRADLWSLGVVLFQMATGRLPFLGAHTLEILHNARTNPLPQGWNIDASLSREQYELIERLLQKRPEDRLSSARDVLASLLVLEHTLPDVTDLQATESGHSYADLATKITVVQPVNLRGRKRGRVALWLGVLTIGIALSLWWSRPDPPSTERAIVAMTHEEPTIAEQRPRIEPKMRLKEPPRLTVDTTPAEATRIQQAWADFIESPVVVEEDLDNDVKLKLVLIPPGTFRMGSTDEQINAVSKDFSDVRRDSIESERPAREVTLDHVFFIGKYEVSRAEFRQFVEDVDYLTEAERNGGGSQGWDAEKREFRKDQSFTWKRPGIAQTDDHPVVHVSWNDAQLFCRWLSERRGGTLMGRRLRLPSEAEWEYVCRAGSVTRFSFGDDPELLPENGNVGDATAKKEFRNWDTIHGEDGFVFTSPVGKFRPNAFGLFDLHGNVWEWCEDWYGPYDTLPLTDPIRTERATDDARILRGGSWFTKPGSCRSASRLRFVPYYRSAYFGFRVCLRLE